MRRAGLIALLVLTSSSPAFLLVEFEGQPAPATVCHEDESCWSWRTMGNRCGRDSRDEPIVCVGPDSSDGRYHACGLDTEDGVTEHLNAYAERCGR